MAELWSQDAMLNFIRLTKEPYRPAEILRLQERIEARTCAAELRCRVAHEMDYGDIDAIAEMKHELDRLYLRWARGEI